MDKYIILRTKSFESLEKFQKRINEQAMKGYRAVCFGGQTGGLVLMEKINH